jgi:hypothetical protein
MQRNEYGSCTCAFLRAIERAALQQFAHVARHHGLPGMRAHGMHRGMEGLDAAVVGIQ